MPALSSLTNEDDDDGSLRKLTSDQIRLLAWVFDTEKFFRLSTTEKQTVKTLFLLLTRTRSQSAFLFQYEQIKKLTGQQHTAKVPEPDYVFRLDYDEEAESKFQKRRGDRKTIFAYHGSRLPNFYSIVRNGLRSSLNQVSMFLCPRFGRANHRTFRWPYSEKGHTSRRNSASASTGVPCPALEALALGQGLPIATFWKALA